MKKADTMVDANVTIKQMEKLYEKKNIQALNGIRIHDFCVTGVMLFHLSYQIKPHKSGRVC